MGVITQKTIFCDFCGKVQDHVSQLIKNDNGLAICDECIDRCNEIIKEQREKNETNPTLSTKR